MTPIGLLTKSNSIWGIHDRPNAYRMTKLALPKFAANRSASLRVEMEMPRPPELVPLKSVEVEVISKPSPKAVSVLADPAAAELETKSAVECEMAIVPAVVERAATIRLEPEPKPVEEVVAAKPKKAKARGTWAAYWNIRRLVKRLKPPQAALPMPEEPGQPVPMPVAQTPKTGIWELLLKRITFRRRSVKARGVQTELALDRVAVIRNDLSDADLEVVPRLDAKQREANPFRDAVKTRRAKKAEEEKNAEPPIAPLLGAMAGKPTD